MSQPEPVQTDTKKNMSLLIKGSIWIAIGALIAAALVCVVWVLVGDQDGLIGRAFLTILLLAGFAGIVILDAGLAPNRPDWLALSSIISWIIGLIVGLIKIWVPEDGQFFSAGERFFQVLLVIGILQLALLHVRLFTPAALRYVTPLTRTIYIATIVCLVGLVGMLVFFLTFTYNFDYPDLYWRIVVALTILAAVGTTLIPLLNALFAPKKPAPAYAQAYAAAPQGGAVAAWPTYADGVTPLPALADSSPDWNAYYTGYPSLPTQAAPAQGYPTQGYPGQAAPAQAYPAQNYPAQDYPSQAYPAQQLPAIPDAFPAQTAQVPPVPVQPAAPVQPAQPQAPQEPLAEQAPPAAAPGAFPAVPPAPAPGGFPPAPPLPPQ